MTKVIDSFKGEYYFLSNFYASPIINDSVIYPTVEHFFQAMKTLDKDMRKKIAYDIKEPNEAKKLGRTLDLRPNWDKEIRFKAMWTGINQKFEIHALKQGLLATGKAELIEGNWWGDKFWGVCGGVGENHLGKMLMEKRARLK